MVIPPLRCGILGCSEFAARRMVPAMAASDRVELVAVASRSADAAARFAAAAGCDAVVGYDALLARPDVDAVYLPLPIALHADWVDRALLAGKHVLAEKPLSLDAATTDRLLALAERSGLALTENVLFPHHDQHTAVRGAVAAGTIGAVRSVEAAFAIPRRPPTDVRMQAELGGGALWDTGVYPLRLATYLLGPGLHVRAGTSVRDRRSGVDVFGTALLERADGTTAVARFGIDCAYRNTYTIEGSRGRITVGRAFTPPGDLRPEVRIERADGGGLLSLPTRDQAVRALDAFAAAAELGRPPDATVVREQARLRDDVRAASETFIDRTRSVLTA